MANLNYNFDDEHPPTTPSVTLEQLAEDVRKLQEAVSRLEGKLQMPVFKASGIVGTGTLSSVAVNNPAFEMVIEDGPDWEHEPVPATPAPAKLLYKA